MKKLTTALQIVFLNILFIIAQTSEHNINGDTLHKYPTNLKSSNSDTSIDLSSLNDNKREGDTTAYLINDVDDHKKSNNHNIDFKHLTNIDIDYYRNNKLKNKIIHEKYNENHHYNNSKNKNKKYESGFSFRKKNDIDDSKKFIMIDENISPPCMTNRSFHLKKEINNIDKEILELQQNLNKAIVNKNIRL